MTWSKKKLKVNITDDSFEVDVQILEEKIKTRRWLTFAIFTVAAILALVMAVYGLVTGNFKGLAAVALFVNAPVMSVLGYYYGKSHGPEKENKGST